MSEMKIEVGRDPGDPKKAYYAVGVILREDDNGAWEEGGECVDTSGMLEIPPYEWQGDPIEPGKKVPATLVVGVCRWKETEDWKGDVVYETACGEQHTFFVDGPKENHFKGCPYCGKPIEVEEKP